MKTWFAIASLVLFLALGSAGQEKTDEEATIRLERTACLGTCPVYKLTIKGDGSVLYEGKEYVRVKGFQHASVNPAVVDQLVQRFGKINYFSLQDAYRSIKNPDGSETVVTDLPTTYTSLRVGGRYKKIEDYVGAPKELIDLEAEIDSAAGSKRWVAIDGDTVHEEARHGWNVNSPDARKLFMDAIEGGDEDAVGAFLAEGTDAKHLVGGIAPLQVAHGSGIVKMLISAGADVNVTSNVFDTPLAETAKAGDVESMKVLIDAGARVNNKSTSGETPLMNAASSGNPDAVKILLSAAADVSALDVSGRNALWYARNALSNQELLAQQPDPFSMVIPDYRARYAAIRELLIAAGATEATSTAH